MSETRQLLVQDGAGHADPDGKLAGDDWSIAWRRLRGGLSEGVTIVTLSSGSLSVTVCPTRGMGVLSATFADIPIGWTSPVAGPVHPQFVNLALRNGLGWLEGFSELICRCGLSSNGPPGLDDGAQSPIESQLTLHGRIANIPADTVEVGFDEQSGEVWVRGACREATLFGPQLTLESQLSLSKDARSFAVADTVTNHGSAPAELELLYHINIGPPILGAGSRFLTSFREMSPRDARAAEGIETYGTYLPPSPGYTEQVYFFNPLPGDDGQATALLTNADNTLGVSVQFNRDQLPCLSQWKCTQPESNGYVTGIEPGTNFPNFKSFERDEDRVVTLAPGHSQQVDLQLAIHPDTTAVQTIAETIATTQASTEAKVHSSPTRPFAPA